MTTADATAANDARYDIAGLIADLGDIPVVTDRTTVSAARPRLLLVQPDPQRRAARQGRRRRGEPAQRGRRDPRPSAACARRRIPITPRGGATGNYGQAVPLAGGVLLDMSAMTRIDLAQARPGARRGRRQAGRHRCRTRPHGWELRMHPSTKRMATIGGFVCGRFGRRRLGHLWRPARARQHPRRARRHAWRRRRASSSCAATRRRRSTAPIGTTGIITELEMPLAPACPWIDVVVAFDDFDRGGAVGHELALADGIVKKLRDADRMAAAELLRRRCRRIARRARACWRCMIAESVDRELQGAARAAAARSRSSADRTRAAARCRSTSTPGTTPRCRC